MARWITIKPEAFPIDYRVRGTDGKPTGGWLHFRLDESDPHDKGERYLTDDQADFMISRGYGVEGKTEKSTARSSKGKTTRRKRARTSGNAAHAGTVASVGDASAADTDRTAGRAAVDHDAG